MQNVRMQKTSGSKFSGCKSPLALWKTQIVDFLHNTKNKSNFLAKIKNAYVCRTAPSDFKNILTQSHYPEVGPMVIIWALNSDPHGPQFVLSKQEHMNLDL